MEETLRDQKLSEQESLDIFLQVVYGFEVLKAYNIIHTDLKPDNIFKNSGMYKIADFGCCKKNKCRKFNHSKFLWNFGIHRT